MKKSIIILLTAMTFISTSAFAGEKAVKNTWDVKAYGEIRAFGELDSRENVDAEVKTSDTKFGFKVKGESGNIGVFGELSANVDVNGSSDTVASRFGYVGVSLPKYGSLSLGKQMSIQEQFVDKADVFYSAGNNSIQKMAFTQKNSVKYTNNISNIKVGALVAAADGDANNDNIDRWQLGVGIKGVGIAVGKDNNTSTDYYGIGFKTKLLDNLGIATSFSVEDASTDASIGKALTWGDDTAGITRGIEFALSYDMSEKLTLTGGYNMTDVDTDDGNLVGQVSYAVVENAVLFSNLEYDIDESESITRAGLSIKF